MFEKLLSITDVSICIKPHFRSDIEGTYQCDNNRYSICYSRHHEKCSTQRVQLLTG